MEQPKCNCIFDENKRRSPHPDERCPVHHPLVEGAPDPYLRERYAGRIVHRHHADGQDSKVVYEGPPEACPYCNAGIPAEPRASQQPQPPPRVVTDTATRIAFIPAPDVNGCRIRVDRGFLDITIEGKLHGKQSPRVSLRQGQVCTLTFDKK